MYNKHCKTIAAAAATIDYNIAAPSLELDWSEDSLRIE